MAVTGFWPVFKNLKATLDYADNPDKTTAPEYLDEDLYAALRYAENDDKTDRKMFVGGINCSAQNAYAEMIAVQRRFGLRGKVVGYHGIQSFREGEVTPEQAFAIGKETARRMWGDRYQVLVTVHLNTDNVHCHFVVNPVSFKDGAKFKNKIGDHKELRKISDEICREHELSVLENSDFYSKGKKKEYWVHKTGKKTHRDYLREDVEYCLSFATSPREFESQLYAFGYTLDPVRFSVKAKHWERAVRLNSIGFSKERVNAQLRQNAENRYRLFTLEYRPPYKPKKFPLEDELQKLDFSIEHSYDTATVLVDAVFYLVITVIQIVAELADVMLLSPDLRAAEKDLKELVADYHFLQEHGIVHGRGRSPSRTDCRLAPQQGIIRLRRPTLLGQLRIVSVRNSGGIHRLHIRVILFTYQFTHKRVEQQSQRQKHTGYRQQSPLHWSFLLCFRPRTTINAATPSSIQPPTVNIQVP